MRMAKIIEGVSIPMWTLINIWFWTIMPVGFKYSDPYAIAWLATALLTWLMGLFLIVEWILSRD